MAPRIKLPPYFKVVATLPDDRYTEIAVRNPKTAQWESLPGAVVGLSHARQAADEGAIVMCNKRHFDGSFRLLVKRAKQRG